MTVGITRWRVAAWWWVSERLETRYITSPTNQGRDVSVFGLGAHDVVVAPRRKPGLGTMSSVA